MCLQYLRIKSTSQSLGDRRAETRKQSLDTTTLPGSSAPCCQALLSAPQQRPSSCQVLGRLSTLTYLNHLEGTLVLTVNFLNFSVPTGGAKYKHQMLLLKILLDPTCSPSLTFPVFSTFDLSIFPRQFICMVSYSKGSKQRVVG